jgi:hypothetical protein
VDHHAADGTPLDPEQPQCVAAGGGPVERLADLRQLRHDAPVGPTAAEVQELHATPEDFDPAQVLGNDEHGAAPGELLLQ